MVEVGTLNRLMVDGWLDCIFWCFGVAAGGAGDKVVATFSPTILCAVLILFTGDHNNQDLRST